MTSAIGSRAPSRTPAMRQPSRVQSALSCDGVILCAAKNPSAAQISCPVAGLSANHPFPPRSSCSPPGARAGTIAESANPDSPKSYYSANPSQPCTTIGEKVISVFQTIDFLANRCPSSAPPRSRSHFCAHPANGMPRIASGARFISLCASITRRPAPRSDLSVPPAAPDTARPAARR
jgi:hypothetical protein